MSVGERLITLKHHTELRHEQNRPLHEVQLKVTEDKLYLRNEKINVIGAVKHMNESRGEGTEPKIR